MTAHIGTATSRVDGRAKVTGAAKYAAEFTAPDLAFGVVVSATIPKGRIVSIDAGRACAVEGVIDVLTHANRIRMADKDEAYRDEVAPEDGAPYRPLYDDRVHFNFQPVALVVAEDEDTARFAATLVDIRYHTEEFATDLHARREQAFKVDKPVKPRGDATKALSGASVRHDADYGVPIEYHNPMELYGSTVLWREGGKLVVYDKTQGVQNVQRYVCGVFELKEGDVQVMSPFVGGAFGSGLRPQYQVVLAAMAALKLKRAVRVVLSRAQMYGLCYRPATIERLALGAREDGTLAALTHEAIAMTSQHEAFSRNDIGWGEVLYASANSRATHRLAKLDVPTPGDMRAPGAASGVYGLECAMDELAVALKMDPLALRLRCYSDRDQDKDLPFSSKRLKECYQQGADAFGWSKRSPEPRSMRDGRELVGWGMASGAWEAMQMPFATRIVMTANGHVEVASATSDIGTGTYTIMAQVAAEMLGVPLDSITVKLGDSTLPKAPVEGGSWTAASISHAIVNAADDIRAELLKIAYTMQDSPLQGLSAEEVTLADGAVMAIADRSRSVPMADIMRHGGMDRIEKERGSEFENDDQHAHNTHSAIFAEVKVDEELGVIRVTRIVSAVAAGRILNTKTAASQIMGGVVMGVGMALHEEATIDHRFGRIMNANVAEYHMPVNADIHDIRVIFVDEEDRIINKMGIKGVGEIGIVGVPAAIANAVYHATGKRVRDLPITLDKLLG
ncbi:xanthine dehydrogenase family protein molybdopterin-binding subunit [Bradyrhizobium sp. 83012]|uniref:Xanthine dehydrogenase family protein molybdopterin-binding subunit n=1 Tax=Bradyrhizobium aeschynomenes TaxID=2734909 RepID=A0ABX2CCR0_9BRAD|nr:xanthine dehydrogenase family protein molybdopterin-binding subunit [Bradyrhizobium aeschynomenes]NPU66004.1 xanthine dehydrogenase family protein molybdopterin-binding subunit [Bradyrhizobium aeschynomenes]NPU66023.1 xanthine dehydrogenase family protein molybdopterin-binding subunit [Bradyrhizobium aeschynomenes]